MEFSKGFSVRKKGKEHSREEIMLYTRTPNYPNREEGLIRFKVTDEAGFDSGWDFQVLTLRCRALSDGLPFRPS